MMRTATKWISAVLMISTAGPAGARAQVTPYVPNLDPAYRDLDVLVAQGLVREALMGQRPYSRAAFGRFVAEASDRVARGETVDARTEEALERLSRSFADPGASAGPAGLVRPRSALSEVSVARSPYRDLRSGAPSDIDGSLDPLLQVNQGRELADGLTWAVEAGLDLGAGFVAGQLRPRLWLDAPRGPEGPGADATLLDAYARTVVGPLGLDVGRNHVALGYGRDGGPLLSHNARGLDMIRLATDRPLRLPGILGVLGLWEPSVLVADMGRDRDIPGSVLTIFRLGSRPSRHVEIGINYLNHQGGEGSPSAPLRERLWDMFFFWKDGGAYEISDKVVGADLRVLLAALRTELYANVLTTDDRGRFSQPAGGLWEDAIWVAGMRVFGLGTQGRVDIQFEWKHAGPIPHTHHQFTSGLTLDGRVVGDALGPNASSLLTGVTWNGSGSVLAMTASWERYSGDDWTLAVIPGGGVWDWEWYLVADNPDEIRRRITLDWTRGGGARLLETSLRLGYEHVNRYAFGSRDRSNFLAHFAVGYRW